MVYRKRPPNSRRYNKNHSAQQQSGHEQNEQNLTITEEQTVNPQTEEALPPKEPASRETKTPKPLSFLSSILGTGDRTERSGSPLFTVFDYDIYFDDLLLVGLIVLLFTDKVEDELLLIILLYLLLDIF
ncbi:hypothetical protein [Ruminiclostridium cellulolyticum]|uniref:Uncharacterized protein n=1 Tax=Ruminiclostridium cellulolyticum (strain ATCC 35319 / DSM 5812 / JCM 6584 / H10) TaxID=394503 RepID=B8I5S4_RUMCH|nr:hypothetical protein [Ruminiclostridium cellulolyticum]ACL74741.1 hypothetical protein Ccel_0356 [Ruminiclostridium cellulolyticum H10]